MPEGLRHLSPDLRHTDAVTMLKAAQADKQQFDVIHFDEPYGKTSAVWDLVISDDYMAVRSCMPFCLACGTT